MSATSRALAVLPVLLLLAARGPLRAHADEAAWRDADRLERHLAAACDAVAQACGAAFRQRPTVRVSDQATIEAVLQSISPGDEGLGETPPHEARRYIAYYDPIGRVVHLAPGAAAELARALDAPELLDEDMLRVVLAHEAAHALDFERFPVGWTLACCSAADERLATEAALEGHAQMVTQVVARAWGIEGAWRRLTDLYTGTFVARGHAEGAAAAFDPEAAFTYVQGQAFLTAVLAQAGPDGVEHVLRSPPTETRVVDRPSLWLDPVARSREPDLQAVLEVFRPLARATGGEVRKWRVLGPAAAAGGRGGPDGYEDNHGLIATAPDGLGYVNVFLAQGRDDAEADALVGALAEVDRRRDADAAWLLVERADGAGAGDALPGFRTRRRPRGLPAGPELAVQVARVGRHVIELTVYAVPRVTRAAADDALALASRLLRAPVVAAPAVALRAQVKDFLRARAEGRLDDARRLLRDLLPARSDLRRVVREDRADLFADGYAGPRLVVRTTPVTDEQVWRTLPEADVRARVRAWGATTEELARGEGEAARFPEAMRTFAAEVAAPGAVWVALFVTPHGRTEPEVHVGFVRLGDRFLWIEQPWTVLEPR